MMRTSSKIKACERQIEELRTVRNKLADRWLEMGYAKCQEACEVIGDQITSLYEEIDALVYGKKTVPSWKAPCDEEALVTREELALVADLGWGAKDLIRHKRKLMARSL